MRRFLGRFLLGAVAMLVLYEAVQRLSPGSEETWEETWEEAGFMTGYTHKRLGEALARDPAPRHARELEALLGVQVVPITEAAYQNERSQASFLTRRDGIELAFRATDGAEDWSVVAALPAGPVSLDAVTLFQESDEAVGPHDVLSLVVLLLGMIGLGVGLIGSPARQLRRLAGTATALRDGDLEARAVAPRGSLVEPVALAFNDMAAQIQRTVAWKELLLQTVAHELRTPLSRVRFIAERVTDAEEAVERDDALAELDRELTELEDLLSSVLSLARADHGAALARTPTDLVDVLEGALDALARRERRRSSPLVLERVGLEAAPPLARVDRAAAARVFDNLLSNAAAHAHQRVRVVLAVEEGALMIAVEDDGEGLSDPVCQ